MNTTRQLIISVLVILSADISRGQKISLAVMDFEARGVSTFEAGALTDRLRNELFRLGIYSIVERGLMEDILREQDFSLTGCTSDECLIEVGRLLSANQMVGGSVSKIGSMFTVSVRLADVEKGVLLKVADYDFHGNIEQLLSRGIKEVALQLINAETQVPPLVTSQPEKLTRSAPSKPPVIRPSRPTFLPINSGLFGLKHGNSIISRAKALTILRSVNDAEINRHLRDYDLAYAKTKQLFWDSITLTLGGLAVGLGGVEIDSKALSSVGLGAMFGGLIVSVWGVIISTRVNNAWESALSIYNQII